MTVMGFGVTIPALVVIMNNFDMDFVNSHANVFEWFQGSHAVLAVLMPFLLSYGKGPLRRSLNQTLPSWKCLQTNQVGMVPADTMGLNERTIYFQHLDHLWNRNL